MSSCPSISWMARRLAPPFSRAVAKEWRRVCGETVFSMPASRAVFFIIISIMVRVRCAPRRFRNTYSSSPGLMFMTLRSYIHFFISFRALLDMGTRRSLPPLPTMRRQCFFLKMSAKRSVTSSLTRRPQENSVSMMARLRCPSHLERSMAASMRSTSSTLSTSGRCTPREGDSSSSDGSSSISPSRTR